MVELPGVASHLDNSQIDSSAAADELPLHRPPRSMRQHVRARGKLVTHLRVGADAYLTKPFDPNEMIRVVRELASATPLAPPS